MLQRLAFQKLHRDESFSAFFANVVDGADVGMIESRGRLRFPPEPGQRLRVARYVFWQELERDEAVQPRILGLVDDTHPTAANFFQDSVVRDGFTNHVSPWERQRLWGHLRCA